LSWQLQRKSTTVIAPARAITVVILQPDSMAAQFSLSSDLCYSAAHLMNRSQLIDHKHAVIAQIQRTRRELERVRMQQDRRSQRRVQELEAQLAQLMAEEHRLRIEIDRTRD